MSVYDRHIKEQFVMRYMDPLEWFIKHDQMEIEKLSKLIDEQGWDK